VRWAELHDSWHIIPRSNPSDPESTKRVVVLSLRKAGLGMNIYLEDEQPVSKIERGRTGEAVLPALPHESPRIGEILRFARSHYHAGRRPRPFNGGEPVLASLDDDAALGKTGHATGRALFRDRWKLLGLVVSLDSPRNGKKAPRFPRLA
jgi:hypothetical protein